MAVHCPKCGRPNPDEAYICQFCDAPLVTYNPPQIPVENPTEEQPPAGTPEQPAQPETFQEGSPEWLEQLRRKKEEDARKLGEDFFNRFGPAGEDSIPTSAGLDDWLSKVRTSKENDPNALSPLAPVNEEKPAEEGVIPDWLSNIRSRAVEEGVIPPSQGSAEETEDWLTKLRGDGQEVKPLIDSSQNWQEDVSPVNPNNEPIQPRDLKNLTGYKEPNTEPEFLQALKDEDKFSEPVEPASDETVYSAYYSNIIPEEPEHPIPEALRNSIPQIDADALTEDVLPPEEQMLEMQDEPRERIPSKDIPKWLSSILGENEEEATPLSAVDPSPAPAAEPVETTQESVEPAALPGWVQAMRPIEQAVGTPQISSELDKLTAESGPLAGISGILPGEGLMTTYTRTTGFDIGAAGDRKKTSEHVAIFNEILATETQAVKVPGYQKTKAAGTIRWLMMILLFAIVLLPIISGTKASSLPNSIPKETVNLFKSITALPAEARVLVAIDYEPAYAGELQSAASPVINHLMVKQANLYLISTSPTGPLLAGQLLDSMGEYPQTFQAPYVSGEKFHVLGYLPGGQTGIKALNASLTQVIPLTTDLKQSTSISGLEGPTPLTSFDAVLVISDQPDTIRYWLEQLTRKDGKPALWVVSSAQAAPMLRPYVRSGQLEGLTAGEYGGTIYERIFQQPGMAWRHWNSYYVGLLGAVLLILAGGILNYTGQSILRNRRKKAA
jgi:hypothetical protein